MLKIIEYFIYNNGVYLIYASLHGSVGWAFDWWSGGCGFDPHRVWQHSVMEIDPGIFSTVILLLPPIQEEQLFFGKECAKVQINCLED